MITVVTLIFMLAVVGLLAWIGICVNAAENHLKRPHSCCQCANEGIRNVG